MKLKNKFDCHESHILKKVYTDNLLVSNKNSFGKKNYKFFIGDLYDDYKIKPLHIVLLKTKIYVKCSDCQIEWMHCLIEDDDLLGKYDYHLG